MCARSSHPGMGECNRVSRTNSFCMGAHSYWSSLALCNKQSNTWQAWCFVEFNSFYFTESISLNNSKPKMISRARVQQGMLALKSLKSEEPDKPHFCSVAHITVHRSGLCLAGNWCIWLFSPSHAGERDQGKVVPSLSPLQLGLYKLARPTGKPMLLETSRFSLSPWVS